LRYIKNNKSIIDIGTGAGFPGIPIRIFNDNINVVLLDSLKKRINFLNILIEKLKLKNVESVHGRAEDYGINVQYRENFEIAIARAVSSLPILLEYCMPFIKINGLFIAMKGSDIEEVKVSHRALDLLGGEIVKIEKFVLPCSQIIRNVIIVKKIKQLSTKYPRKAGTPKAKPLM
jgi:16S rRNA (guanine527-N7)-methyltransferase